MRVTGIGGGHGLAVTLRAARTYAEDVQAVVTVADDGGSSGRLSRTLGIPPPGDIRNCLVALADESNLAELYQHRFSSGPLTGHSMGNLIIAALTELTGSFSDAVSEAGRLLGARGSVHPATNELLTMRARVEGKIVKGQVAVAQTEGRIQAVYLKPRSPEANPAAVEAIMSADQIVLGPGSLFTSLIATLLVPGIKDALRETNAARIFVLNNRMQTGETWGLDAMAHVEALLAHTGPASVDSIVVQSPVLRGDGVPVDKAAIENLGLNVIETDLTNAAGGHDFERLGKVLSDLVE